MAKRCEFICDGIRYYMRGNPNGYGNEIMQVKGGRYKSIFRSLDKETVLYQFSCIENMDDPTTHKFPNTVGEMDMMKVLRIEAKHYTYHFSVPTHSLFHKAFRKFLTDEYGKYVDNFKPQEPVNDTGLTCREDIDQIPFVKLRSEIEEKWTEYEKLSKKHKSEMREWENLKAVVTTENRGIAIDAIEYLRENDTWELINLDIVE